MTKGFLTIGSRSVGAALLYLLLLSSCGYIGKQQLLHGLHDTPQNSELYTNGIIGASTPDDTTVYSLDTLKILMERAGSYCQEKRFTAADSIYRILLPQLNSLSIDSISDEFINEIAMIYSTVMPSSITAPEEIALEVYQQQMMLTLDSLSLDSTDSTMISQLIKKSNVCHDIPIIQNNRVEKALLYYITRNKGTIESWKKRSVTYLSFMKRLFADSALPQDLAYLPLIESGFNPKAYSRSHASGIWQFIPSTGKMYGLRSNYWFDERRDPLRSTNAAIRYLKKLYKDFGDWHLALAAYNCGEGAVSRAITRSGTSDYWQLRLPKETMNYVPLYLAALTIARDPEFAAVAESQHDTIPFDTVSISECIDLRQIASGINIPYDTLKKLNPHILHWCTPPDMTNVLLYLPSGTVASYHTFYAALPEENKVKWHRYKVQRGDNLGSIARRFKIPIEGIKLVNKIQGSRIIAGNFLFIPIPASSNGSLLYSEKHKSITGSESEMCVTRHVGREKVPEGASLVVYEVKSGDTVSELAELFGVSEKQICGWNNLIKARIKTGQVLSIYTTEQTRTVLRTQKSRSSDQKSGVAVYIVKSGDTPFGIAHNHSMTVKELLALNNINTAAPLIHPGDTVRVNKNRISHGSPSRLSASAGTESSINYIVAAGDNLYRIARNFSVSVATLRTANHLSDTSILQIGDTIIVPAGPAAAAEEVAVNREYSDGEKIDFYTVKHGDNLWRIANSLGIPMKHLYEYNGLQSNSVLMPGDTIRFSKKGAL